MPVPEAVRKVARPINTVVVDRGVNGPKRYAVRERIGVKYGPRGNPQPINGRVIGHIFNGVFVACEQTEKVAPTGPQELSYGAAAFVHSEIKDLLDDLLKVYPITDACTIICIAMLRCIKPDVKNRRLSTEYHRTFVSRFIPGIALTSNTVGKFLDLIGQDTKKRHQFFLRRLAGVAAQHHILIDGMLKQDTSEVNDLSHFSYKARVKGCKDISILYAYDLERMEPVCAEVFAGNQIDAATFATFIDECHIEKGIIVADKGFPPSQIEDQLQTKPALHFLIPIKRNDKRIQHNNMLDYQGVLTGIDQQISYCKKKIRTGRYLYAFKNHSKANGERYVFIERMKKDRSLTQADLKKNEELFGVIVFESDQDISPLATYLCYEDRWQIELVFDAYKNDELLDHTNVQSDFALRGSEFVNFMTTVLTCRLRRRAQRAGLLNNLSFKDLMEDLATVWRKVDGPMPPKADDRYWVADYKGAFTLMETLGLIAPAVNSKPALRVTAQGIVVPRKAGRPRVRPVFVGPKRPRGRPHKTP